MSSSEDGYYTVERLIDKKVVHGVPFYLVKWKEFDDSGCTWEPVDSFKGINMFYVDDYEREHAPKPKKSTRKSTKATTEKQTKGRSKSPKPEKSPNRGKKKTKKSSVKKEPEQESEPEQGPESEHENESNEQNVPIKAVVKELEIESESDMHGDDKTQAGQSVVSKVKLEKEPETQLPVAVKNEMNVGQDKIQESIPEEKEDVNMNEEKENVSPLNEVSPSKTNMIDYMTHPHGVLGKDIIERIEGMKTDSEVIYVNIAWKVRKNGIRPENSIYTFDELRKYENSRTLDFLSDKLVFLMNEAK